LLEAQRKRDQHKGHKPSQKIKSHDASGCSAWKIQAEGPFQIRRLVGTLTQAMYILVGETLHFIKNK